MSGAGVGFELSPDQAGAARLHTGNAGTEAAWFHLMREANNLPVVARFTLDGEPVSKARARFTGYGSKARTYTPEKTREAERQVAAAFRSAVGPTYKPSDRHTFGIVAIFFNGNRQRRDVDNMLKLILDGLNRVAWADDNQVVEVSARKSFGDMDSPRTEVLVYIVGTIDRDTKECPQCGTRFPVYRSTAKTQIFCSRACHSASRVKSRLRVCEHCAAEFDSGKVAKARRWCSEECRVAAGRTEVTCSRCGVTFNKQRCHVRPTNYCSPECRDQAAAARRSASQRAGDCASCGGPVSRKEYVRCQACRVKGSRVSGNPGVAP